MVCSHSLAGVALGEAAQAEATELAPEAVGASPPVATRIGPGLPVRFRLEGFARADVFLLLVKLWSRGFGRGTRRPPGWPGAQNGFASSASDRGPQRRTR